MKLRRDNAMGLAVVEAEKRLLQHENDELKRLNLALYSELYGARLATRYLDKELAGRFVLLVLSQR